MAVMVGQWQKNLLMTIQMNLVPIPNEAGMREHKFTSIAIWPTIAAIFGYNLHFTSL